jgi:uncharacterized lipoprotein YddW (UPF0748 family)
MRWLLLAFVLCAFVASCTRHFEYTSIPLIDPASTTRPASLEPGEAESTDRASIVPMPKTWSHPSSEIRGAWIDSKELMQPRDRLLTKLDALKAANFNTVLIDTWFRGYVAYPGSELVPQYPELNGRDVIAELVDACHARGMQAHLWPSYGFYAYWTPDASKDSSVGPILARHPELLSVDAAGRKFIHRTVGDFYSLCPSNPQSQDLLAALFAEAVQKHPGCDGLSLDRIRYADNDYCYCNYCKTKFEHDTGIALDRVFPAGSTEARIFLRWKREQTVKAVERIVRAVRGVRPNIVITSYVLGPQEMDSKAQAWDLWMKAGLLDAVAVSTYGADIRPATRRAIELLGGDASHLISAISAEQTTPVYLTNVEVSRGFHTIGQFTWYSGALADDDLQGLTRGPYSEAARSPLEPK